jgi:flagellar biosynthesis/type III secretory pathway M-ring protein FliF/YscJ
MREEHRPEVAAPSPQELLISNRIAQIAKPCQYRGASMDFLGNIGLRLVGALVTVGVLVAIYFLAIKPATDTANNAINSFAKPIQQAQQDAHQAEQQLQQSAKSGGAGSNSDLNQLNRLQRCVQKAHQNVAVLQKCTERFAP